MCGLAGVVHFGTDAPVDPLLLKRMGDVMAHRGPDDEGWYLSRDRRVGLAHRRLSIIDLAGGKQPMANKRATLWVVYNGEIYNFKNLRASLELQGYSFRTHSDTEVILSMYQRHGEKSFDQFNGMFAFALYDVQERCVFLVRDPFGVKPLYYSIQSGRVLFGSEMKAILSDPLVERQVDVPALHTFLALRYNPSPQTLFKGIFKLSPGRYLKITLDGECRVLTYGKMSPPTPRHLRLEDAREEYRRLLAQAIQRQLFSDVPVGLLLSGGVDSAALGYLMQRFASSRIKTFTIAFPGEGDFNELREARATAQFLGTDHHELTITKEEYLSFFAKSFFYTEEPIAQTTIPALYYVSRLASRHLKVVLAGQGADEPLGGYPKYLGIDLIRRFHPLLRLLAQVGFFHLLPNTERFRRMHFAARETGELDTLLAASTIFTREERHHLIRRDFSNLEVPICPESFERLYTAARSLPDLLSKSLYLDTRTSLPDNLLLFNDKMTMANSLELRVPFLDKDLVAFVESLPTALKLRGTKGKFIHKQAMRGWLPDEILDRKKRGFLTPMDAWLTQGLGSATRRLLNERNSATRHFFRLDYVNELLDAHQRGSGNYQEQLFVLLSFECWYRTFFEQKTLDPNIFECNAEAARA